MDYNRIIQNTMDQLCNELLNEKQSYFSKKGRPDQSWRPLKETTISKKKYLESVGHNLPGTATSFNIGTGTLKNSLQVTWEVIPGGVRIRAWSTDDPALVSYLTKFLGRDFLEFTNKNVQDIAERFITLFKKNIQ